MLWWVNRGLHLFGWAIVAKVEDDGSISAIYPARTQYRGFDSQAEAEGFAALNAHMLANAAAQLGVTKE